MRKPQAFTLLEMVMVIVIMAIILAVTIPTTFQFSRLINLDAAARSVVSDLNSARQLARSSSRHIQVSFSGNTISFKDGTKQIKTGALPAGIKFTYPKTLGFAASGFPSPGESGTVIIGNMRQGQRKVIVSSLGRIRVE